MAHPGHMLPAVPAQAGENAVGEHIHMEFRLAIGRCHDLHGLLHPEHLGSVFQQQLTGLHRQLQYLLGIFHLFCSFPYSSRASQTGSVPFTAHHTGGISTGSKPMRR